MSDEQHTIKESISADEVDDTLLDNLFDTEIKHTNLDEVP